MSGEEMAGAVVAGGPAEKPAAGAAPGGNPPIVYRRARMYPAQEAAFFNPSRWSLCEGTTKAGKTAGLIIWLSEQAVRGKEGNNFWWVAPVAPTAAIAYRRMCKAIPYNLRTTHDTLQRITLVNGTHIWFKSGEKPDNLYGEDVYAAVIDEASRVREESWHALRTTLSATKGQCRIIGNVKGRRNWFFKLCRKAEAGAADMSYHKLTWRDAVKAGILDAAEIEDARNMLPPVVFRELYEAEAGDDQGNPFGMEAIADCVGEMSSDPAACWGQDFARKANWNVGIGLDRLGRVCRIERFQKPWREAIAEMAGYLRGTPALCDSTGVGDVIIDALQAKLPAVEGYWFTQTSKQRLMENLAIGIQTRKIRFPEGVIRNELESFEYQYTRTGVLYAAAEGCEDDAVCALALAWLHHGQHGGGTFQFDRVQERAQLTDERGGIERNREILI